MSEKQTKRARKKAHRAGRAIWCDEVSTPSVALDTCPARIEPSAHDTYVVDRWVLDETWRALLAAASTPPEILIK